MAKLLYFWCYTALSFLSSENQHISYCVLAPWQNLSWFRVFNLPV